MEVGGKEGGWEGGILDAEVGGKVMDFRGVCVHVAGGGTASVR